MPALSRLSERTLLALSLATLLTGLAQVLFRPDPGISTTIDLFDWSVIGIFTLDYAEGFAASPSRLQFASSPSSLLTLSIIALAAIGAFLSSPILYSAPALRLLRILRLSDEASHPLAVNSKHV